MKYKMDFIKISHEHKFAGVGFAGNIFIILNALTYLTHEDRLFVDMETNECACTDKEFNKYGTKNCWENYFEQTTSDNIDSTLNSMMAANIAYENREMFMYPSNFIDLKTKFYNNFKLRDDIQVLIDDYYKTNI